MIKDTKALRAVSRELGKDLRPVISACIEELINDAEDECGPVMAMNPEHIPPNASPLHFKTNRKFGKLAQQENEITHEEDIIRLAGAALIKNSPNHPVSNLARGLLLTTPEPVLDFPDAPIVPKQDLGLEPYPPRPVSVMTRGEVDETGKVKPVSIPIVIPPPLIGKDAKVEIKINGKLEEVAHQTDLDMEEVETRVVTRLSPEEMQKVDEAHMLEDGTAVENVHEPDDDNGDSSRDADDVEVTDEPGDTSP